MASDAPVRLLCLHGWAGNERAFRRQARTLLKLLARRNIEAVVPSAPLKLPPPRDGRSREDARCWFYYDAEDLTSTARAFAAEEYVGWTEETAPYLRDFEATAGPFDGVLGFSQGAVAAHLLCCGGVLAAAPKFAVLLSGFPARSAAAAAEPSAAEGTRSVHVSGARDDRVPPALQAALAARFGVAADAVWTHRGAHSASLSKPETRDLASRVRALADDSDGT